VGVLKILYTLAIVSPFAELHCWPKGNIIKTCNIRGNFSQFLFWPVMGMQCIKKCSFLRNEYMEHKSRNHLGLKVIETCLNVKRQRWAISKVHKPVNFQPGSITGKVQLRLPSVYFDFSIVISIFVLQFTLTLDLFAFQSHNS